MAEAAAQYAVVVQEKVLTFGEDESAHRVTAVRCPGVDLSYVHEQKNLPQCGLDAVLQMGDSAHLISHGALPNAMQDEGLASELAATGALAKGTAPIAATLTQPGGGCVVIAPGTTTSMANVGTAVCVFEG